MLTLRGQAFANCDRISRREFVRIGGLGLGGLTLPHLLRAQALAGESANSKAIIFVQLAGGPSQFDTYDPKPEAPDEFRGPLTSRQTKLRGVLFGEYMQEQAKVADRMAILRAITTPAAIAHQRI